MSGEVAALVGELRDGSAAEALRAARGLKKIAETEPGLLAGYEKALLKAALRMDEAGLQTRWQLTIVLGKLTLKGRDRLAAVDWLWERLRDESALERTFAMQALFELSGGDRELRGRVMVVVREFAATGTAAMRARARRLMREV